jgi:hypothetical protein
MTDVALDFQPITQPYVPSDHPEGFTVKDEETAAWVARKLRHIDKQLTDHDRTMQNEVALIQQWHGEVTGPLLMDRTHWEGLLRQYHQHVVLPENPKLKTVKLPGVQLTARKQPDQWEWTDEKAFIEWADKNLPTAVRRKDPEVDKAEAKKLLKEKNGVAITADGEIAPGVAITIGENKHDVKVGA